MTDRTSGKAFVGGEVVELADAKISLTDRGLLLGDGVFDVLRTVGTRLVDGDAHIDRLLRNAAQLELSGPPRADIEAAVTATVGAFGGSARVRIMLTRGDGPASARLGSLGPARLYVLAEPLPELPPTPIYLRTVEISPCTGLAGIKSLSYLEHLLAREAARHRGADEAIRLTGAGAVGECGLANLFLVVNGTIRTAPADGQILPGVTRARVITLLRGQGITVEDTEPIPQRMLEVAEAAFVTSSVRGVVAVGRINDRELSASRPIVDAVTATYNTFLAELAASGVPSGASLL